MADYQQIKRENTQFSDKLKQKEAEVVNLSKELQAKANEFKDSLQKLQQTID